MFLTMIIPLRRRRAIPLDLFFEYWVNAHAAQIAARLPGIHDLWLHELDYDAGQLWPRVSGVESELAEEDRFEGIPEPAFVDEAGVQAFLAAAAPLMDDEPNIFEETVAYQSIGDNSTTFVDRSEPNAAGGDRGIVKFLVFLQARDSADAFRAFATGELAPRLAASEHVLKLRQHLFEPYHDDYGGMDARGLSHAKTPEKQYQGMVEIGFRDRMSFGAFARSDAWAGLRDRYAEALRGAHAFAVPVTHRLRRDGELTLAGLRTPMVADLIERVGAASQLEPAVVDLQMSSR
jgi:hypothetical protein